MNTKLHWQAKKLIRRRQANLVTVYVAFLCLYPASPVYAELNFNDLQAELQKSPSSWQARHSVQNQKRLQQLRRSSPAVLTAEEESTRPDQLRRQTAMSSSATKLKQTASMLPARFDWRDVNGYNFLQSVETDQGECGSCVAFAAVSALESTLNIHCSTVQKSPTDLVNLSRQYFFSCGGGDCDSGWQLSNAVDFLVQHGVPDQSCLPYTSEDGKEVSCNQACSDVEERIVQGFQYQRPTKGWINVDAIKKALLHAPLITSIILFEDLAFYESGVYRHQSGNQLGSHAITLVGWDDETRSWIAKNSWGTDWGDEGFFQIAWDDASLPGRYTWLFQFDSADQMACK